MANAKKCDRCGKFYERRDPDIVKDDMCGLETLVYVGNGTVNRDQHFDLCPECVKSFHEWMGTDDNDLLLDISIVKPCDRKEYVEFVHFVDDNRDRETFLNSDLLYIPTVFPDIKIPVLRISEKADTYEYFKVFSILSIIYSARDNVIKLCNYNDCGCTKQLDMDDIITVCGHYPKDAIVKIEIKE